MADLPKLLVPPDSEGYGVQDGKDVIATQLDGGAPRLRADVLGAVATVDVQWTVGPADFNYLRAFHRQYKAQTFLFDLIIDGAALTEYEVSFVPGSFKTASQRGLTYVLQAQLNAVPLPIDVDSDTMLLNRNS